PACGEREGPAQREGEGPSHRLPVPAPLVMPLAVPVMPVLLGFAVRVMLVAMPWRRIVRPTVRGAGMIIAAAQQQAGGGQHEESRGGTRESQAHHVLPSGAELASGRTGWPGPTARRPCLREALRRARGR